MLTETKYAELKKLGAQKAAAREDGKLVYQKGKNYLLGYYEGKLEDAMAREDDFEIKLYKKEIDKVKQQKVKEPERSPFEKYLKSKK
jgi:hypothetical protein